MSLPWFEPQWPAPNGVRVLSTWRAAPDGGDGAPPDTGLGASRAPYAAFNLGDHVGDDPLAVAGNRRILRSGAGLPAEPKWLAQVHGIVVADLDAEDRHGRADAAHLADVAHVADAAVTRQAGTVCAILTADCLPIALTTEAGDVVAAAHAGWRGLAAGIIGATVRAMRVPSKSLMAWLGPAIGPNHFEVGGEVREAMLKVDPGAGEAFKPGTRGRFMADLPMLVRRQLNHLGVERVYGSGECTYACADRYFSYRRDGVTGRQATLIWREA